MGSTGAVAQWPEAQVAGQTDDESTAAESTIAEPVEELEAGAEARPEPDALTERAQRVPYKVLIVEDATELAEVIAATLERINITTFHETHVERALEVYRKEQPDIILLDIGLPDKTGWKLIDAIKESDEADRPLVIVITAHGDPANRLMGKLQGVHSYLIKPFTPNEVEQVVGSALVAKIKGIPVEESEVKDIPLPEFLLKILEGPQADTTATEGEEASVTAAAAESSEAVHTGENAAADSSDDTNSEADTITGAEKAVETTPAATIEGESAETVNKPVAADGSDTPGDSPGTSEESDSTAEAASEDAETTSEDDKASDS